MTAINSGLKEIHDLREKLEQLTSQIEKGPRQVQARQKNVDSKKLELESLRSKLKHLKVGSEQKNLQLNSYEGRIHDLEGKLNSVSSNREYDALGNQIAADKMANSVLEDEIIEALEGIDKMQSEIVAFENELITVELERTAFGNTVTQKEPELRRQIEELQTRVSDVESMLPAEIVLPYRRLVQAYGARALAPVNGKSCGECYVGLTAQSLVELKSGRFKFCTCGRLMYFVESPAATL